MEEKKPKNKIYFYVSLIVMSLLIIFVYLFLFRTSEIPAQLNVESVIVNLNNIPVSGNVKLSESDIIETLSSGKASVILYESVVVNLEENTKIKISDLQKAHPKIEQEKGSTWNTFTKLFGVKEYTLQSGNSVASIRGTSFSLSENKIFVGDGNVDYKYDGTTFLVDKNKVVENGISRKLTSQEKKQILTNYMETLDQLRFLRKKTIEENPIIIKMAIKMVRIEKTTNEGDLISQRQITESEIDLLLDKVDNGELSISEIEAKAPKFIAPINKVLQLTKEIIKVKALIKEYS